MTEPLWHNIVREIWTDGVEIIYEQWKLLLDEAQGEEELTEIWDAILVHDFGEEFEDWLEDQE